jgi:N-acetylglucosaminyldiphosphoundecaprenol N-acetyl-beta-D-mannosaminyltransferase
MNKVDDNVNIFGIPIFSGNQAEVLKKLDPVLTGTGMSHPIVVLTPTTEQVVMAQQDDTLCATFRAADINVPDTAGLVFACKMLEQHNRNGARRLERIPGVDLAEALCARAVKLGLNVFLLGGKGSTAQEASQALQKRFSGLRVVGEEGIRNFQNSCLAGRQVNSKINIETQAVIKLINEFRTDILLVAFGAPWQERWVTEHKNELHARVVMVVGGAFDYWSGKVPRAPLKWRKFGMEWCWRLIHEPWRWRRQLRLLEFMRMVGREWLRTVGSGSGLGNVRVR